METSHKVRSMRPYEEKRFLERALRDYQVREDCSNDIDVIAAFPVGAAPVCMDGAEILCAA